MGYELHIHRAADEWLDATDAPITEAEWLAVADADPDLVRDGSYLTARPDGSTEELPTFTFTPPGQDDACGFSLDPLDGRITVAGAYDVASRTKVVAVARKLDARVQGDDGEFYGPDGEPLVEEEPPTPPKRGLFDRLRRR
jgi:hypothetical protein